jgi:hypothetical protein
MMANDLQVHRHIKEGIEEDHHHRLMTRRSNYLRVAP